MSFEKHLQLIRASSRLKTGMSGWGLVARRLRDVRLSYRHFERKREIFLADRETMYV